MTRLVMSRTRGDLRFMRDGLADDQWHASAAYDRGEAGQAGIVDHVSFQVMRRLGITAAFTNDLQFEAAGYTVLF